MAIDLFGGKMVQDIFPSKLHNEYINAEISAKDSLFIFTNEMMRVFRDKLE